MVSHSMYACVRLAVLLSSGTMRRAVKAGGVMVRVRPRRVAVAIMLMRLEVVLMARRLRVGRDVVGALGHVMWRWCEADGGLKSGSGYGWAILVQLTFCNSYANGPWTVLVIACS